jgi:hypothetical protein
MPPDVVEARIALHIALMRLRAAELFLQLSRHDSGGALPHACVVAPCPRPSAGSSMARSGGEGFFLKSN